MGNCSGGGVATEGTFLFHPASFFLDKQFGRRLDYLGI